MNRLGPIAVNIEKHVGRQLVLDLPPPRYGISRAGAVNAMLLLTHRLEESLLIGNNVEVKVLSISHGQVTLGITAPTHIPHLSPGNFRRYPHAQPRRFRFQPRRPRQSEQTLAPPKEVNRDPCPLRQSVKWFNLISHL